MPQTRITAIVNDNDAIRVMRALQDMNLEFTVFTLPKQERKDKGTARVKTPESDMAAARKVLDAMPFEFTTAQFKFALAKAGLHTGIARRLIEKLSLDGTVTKEKRGRYRHRINATNGVKPTGLPTEL